MARLGEVVETCRFAASSDLTLRLDRIEIVSILPVNWRLAKVDDTSYVARMMCGKVVDLPGQLVEKAGRSNLVRWRAEGNRFQASIEKVSEEARKLEELIQELESKRTSVKFRMSSTWQDPNGRVTAVDRTHPPSRSR
ncbi:hypothetical protein PV04_01921 [Phialophora macrospora]|uniref:Uncharacterized protein n=1 Tax=Phialophora macrospora TaxID=1851006 RepID=A0A0D2FZ67_9EURO|nr:hypothetical protein PV04_01921 [Phialophora macrospora]